MIVSSFFFGTALIDGLHEVRGIAIRQGILHSYHQYPWHRHHHRWHRSCIVMYTYTRCDWRRVICLS